ncbi:hypothetical protein VAT7223_02759 [Vibrio atlanticus]|uniref:Uncharacterized protein n=2 Tax=Vibrio atlanticus TaxID=693153 RepID=A0A1C3IVT5_9VIBR|nr:hypothetical protein [Vibrio atlanticus]SBS65539.1 hypothetical protein VAT7223_02759 [Vibrio atlanticus]
MLVGVLIEMKLGLKLAVAAFPVPTAFWVLKSKASWWVKVIVTLWALFWGIMLIGSFSSEMPTNEAYGVLSVLSLLALIVALLHQCAVIVYQQALGNEGESSLGEIEIHKEYDMTYRDSKGKISERSIILRGIEHKNGEEYLQATCLLRRRSRTFKKSNIITLTDTDTGEVVI